MSVYKPDYDVAVIGGGHAGIEAAAAACRLGCRTLLVTLALDKIGALSCNPAIGGVGKGQLVKEIDALGGLMGELADEAGIQFRRLNTNRGAAVQSSRMQVDMELYRRAAQRRLAALPGLTLLADEAVALVRQAGRITHVRLAAAGDIGVRSLVVTPGTFFHGLIHIGHEHFPGGRLQDPECARLPQYLADLGLRFGRFKTGTTPRLDGHSIDFAKMAAQPGDQNPEPFSRRSAPQLPLPQLACYITRTTAETHCLIREALPLSALYSGIIQATGVRYCPSVEDKIVKFSGRDSHHVFVEPEGLDGKRYYPNGLSNSLPLSVQAAMVHSVPGLEHAVIVQPGYGIEHDYLDPTQLTPALECKSQPGLFFAGQINGTTGYEEAAAQGLMAGLNAALQVQARPPAVLDRSQAYIGVLIDDLVTRGTNEPYRMFTSRVEYRLLIREDNAAERLMLWGHQQGLVSATELATLVGEQEILKQEMARLRKTRIKPSAVAESGPVASMTALQWLRQPEVHYAQLAELDPAARQMPPRLAERLEIEIKYAGYIKRQAAEIEQFKHLENIRIPADFKYQGIPGISREIEEKLTRLRPLSLGQASRVSGVTPAAVTVLMIRLARKPPQRGRAQ